MNYFVTGGEGFIGSHLIANLRRPPFQDTVELSKGDICFAAGLKQMKNVDVIFHLAATTDTRETPDTEVYRNNLLGFLRILDLAIKKKARLVFASSCQVYGNGTEPLTAYGHSKLLQEEIAKRYLKTIPIVGLRLFNVFGPNELQKKKMASMVTRWAWQIKTEGRPTAFRDEKAMRDFIYVFDVIKALRLAESLPSGFYDVGSGRSVSFDYVLDQVELALGIKTQPIWVENPFKGKYQTFTKARLDWEFKPDWTLESGIEHYLKNYPDFFSDDYKKSKKNYGN